MNYFDLIGKFVTSKTGMQGIVKSIEKKGNKYILHLKKENGYAWFDISLLDEIYKYKTINGYDYDELKDLFRNCIEGDVSYIAISVLEENQKLKEETAKLKHWKELHNCSILAKQNTELFNQQKDFIKYLEDEIEKIKEDIFRNCLTSEDIDLYIKKVKLLKTGEILQKYKERIGDGNSETIFK